jgi:glycosyltransferase involved in cell wall biosynthesis
MNLLEVVESCGAGVGRHVQKLCEGLAAEGHLVTVAYAPWRADEAFLRFVASWEDRISFVTLDAQREVSPVSDLRAFAQLVRLIRKRGPFDVIHGHSSKGGALARIAGRALGIPTVYTPHGLILASPRLSKTEYFGYALIERFLGHLATSKFIAVSEDESEYAIKIRLTSDKGVAVIENAIDDQDLEYLPEEVLDEDVSYKPLTFGSAMRFSYEKAPWQMVEAFIRLNSTLPQLPMRLVIAGDGMHTGDGELFSYVRRQVEESGLSDKILLLGWRSDVREVLRGLDVFVVSSLTESGLSYAIMEAMAARLPIVSTDVFGTRRTLSEVPGNILVPTGNPDALAEGMKRIATLAEPKSLRESLQEIGRANRDYVRTHFSQVETTRRTIELYRSLVGQKRQCSGV